MNRRIKEIRETLKLSQSGFANMLNLKRNSISLIEVGKRNPSDRTILDICQKFNVSEDWLRTGTGEMFLKTPTNTMEQLKKEFNLDEFSFNLVHEYLKLAPSQREKVRDFFYRVIESEENVLNIPQTPEEFEKQVILENELSDNAPSHSKETTIVSA